MIDAIARPAVTSAGEAVAVAVLVAVIVVDPVPVVRAVRVPGDPADTEARVARARVGLVAPAKVVVALVCAGIAAKAARAGTVVPGVRSRAKFCRTSR